MMKKKHPYQDLEHTQVWKRIERAIGELVDNGDLIETTPRPYIIGYLTRQILDPSDSADLSNLLEKLAMAGMVLEPSPSKSKPRRATSLSKAKA